MPKLSVSISRVSVEGLKLVILSADFLLNLLGEKIVVLSDSLVSSGRIGGYCVVAASSVLAVSSMLGCSS